MCISVPGWTTANYIQQVPVRAHVHGIGLGRGPNAAPHNFEHFYDFMDFQTSVSDPTVFEVNLFSLL